MVDEGRSGAEEQLLDGAAAGRTCDVSELSGDDRRVRAEVLHELLTGDRQPLHAKGAHLVGGVVVGDLDFDYGTLRAPLRLTRCRVEGALSLEGATVPALVLVGCHLAGAVRAPSLRSGAVVLDGSVIEATVDLAGALVESTLGMDRVEIRAGAPDGGDPSVPALDLRGIGVGGSMFVRDGVIAGPVQADGARVGVILKMDGTTISCPDEDGCALHLHGIRVGGDVCLNRTHIAGAVWAIGARIDLSLEMQGTRITGHDREGRALDIRGLETGLSAFLRGGFEAAGSIAAHSAHIGRTLDMGTARLHKADSQGDALIARSIEVGGTMRLDQGFRSAGAVRLGGATIHHALVLAGARIDGANDRGNALDARGIRVGGDADIDDGFHSQGAVRLAAAVIDGHLSLRGADLGGPPDAYGNSLVANGMHVGGSALLGMGFRASAAVRLVGAVVDGQLSFVNAAPIPMLSLRGARCAELADHPASWPEAGRLELRGFRFGAIKADTGWSDRLDWARRQGFAVWSPDPYEQLAGYYRSIGDEDAARRMRIARNRDELTHLKTVDTFRARSRSGVYRLRRRAFGWLLGYGYQRHRAGWLLLATVLIAGGMFLRAEHTGAMVPNVEPPYADEPCGQVHPCFNSWVYGADVVLPIVDLGQDAGWRPLGGVWPHLRWLLIGIGWLLASVFVAAFTGLVQRE